MREPKQRPPALGKPTHLATCNCNHCGHEAFNIIMNCRGIPTKVGDRVEIKGLPIDHIVCVTCGETFAWPK